MCLLDYAIQRFIIKIPRPLTRRKSGISKIYRICAALNRSNINVQLLTIEAAMTRSKDKIYQAAMMDPHLQSELSIDDIVALCDDLIIAHEGWLPAYH